MRLNLAKTALFGMSKAKEVFLRDGTYVFARFGHGLHHIATLFSDRLGVFGIRRLCTEDGVVLRHALVQNGKEELAWACCNCPHDVLPYTSTATIVFPLWA